MNKEFSEGTLTREELKGFPTEQHDGTNGIELNFVTGEWDWIDPVQAVISADEWTYYDNGYSVYGYKNDEIVSRKFYELEPTETED